MHEMDVTVGMFVYQYGSPQKAGIVTRRVGFKPHTVDFGGGTTHTTNPYHVEVLWHNKDEPEEVPTGNLVNFNKLIADHERKLQTHLKMRDKLRSKYNELTSP
jgi:hypothetical protein